MSAPLRRRLRRGRSRDPRRALRRGSCRESRAQRSASSMSASRPAAALPRSVARAGRRHRDRLPGSAGSGSASARPGARSMTARRRRLTAALPADGFRMFGATDDPAADLPRQHASWIETVAAEPRAGPRRPALPRSAAGGGRHRRRERRLSGRRADVASLRRARCSPAMGCGEDGARRQRASPGLMLAPEVAVATGLTQGCMPIGPVHRIDEARDKS